MLGVRAANARARSVTDRNKWRLLIKLSGELYGVLCLRPIHRRSSEGNGRLEPSNAPFEELRQMA